MLSIEQQLLQAQRQLAELNAQRIDRSILLMQALGGGFQADAAPGQQQATAASPASRHP